ncbi:MAG: hypothetical protein FWB96_10240 [Defluviitaleaceae bacterium]|nr:hypothetical protein [Defluviitaleaceae bacterium]MCL2263270.1 hypothetical protein [Defluviitaleaceae bacterium]
MNAKNQLTKKSKNRIAVFVAAIGAAIIGLVMLISSATSAGGTTLPSIRDIFTLYDTYNMTVVVVFDEESPIVQFIAPDGGLVDMDNIRYRPGSNFVQYFLPNAMPGVWTMAYDPLSNTEITTPYSVYMNHIFIRDFAANTAGSEVSFEVSADDAGQFAYEIHAVFTAYDNSIADEILLVRGFGELNENLLLALDTDKIYGMGGFMLRLTAYVQYGQAAIRDSAWLDLRLSAISN